MGYSQFQARYGTETDPITGEPIISAAWQSGLQNGVQVGSIIGLYLNGVVSEAIGYRKTMMGSLVLMVAFIFLPFFAPNVQTILAGAILSGIPWGVFQTLTVTYASEVTPTNIRAYLTTYVNLCWVSLTLSSLLIAGSHFTNSGIGLRTAYCCWCPPRMLYSRQRMGLPNSLCDSMGLAHSHLHRSCFSSGIAMVVSPKREV